MEAGLRTKKDCSRKRRKGRPQETVKPEMNGRARWRGRMDGWRQIWTESGCGKVGGCRDGLCRGCPVRQEASILGAFEERMLSGLLFPPLGN